MWPTARFFIVGVGTGVFLFTSPCYAETEIKSLKELASALSEHKDDAPSKVTAQLLRDPAKYNGQTRKDRIRRLLTGGSNKFGSYKNLRSKLRERLKRLQILQSVEQVYPSAVQNIAVHSQSPSVKGEIANHGLLPCIDPVLVDAVAGPLIALQDYKSGPAIDPAECLQRAARDTSSTPAPNLWLFLLDDLWKISFEYAGIPEEFMKALEHHDIDRVNQWLSAIPLLSQYQHKLDEIISITSNESVDHDHKRNQTKDSSGSMKNNATRLVETFTSAQEGFWRVLNRNTLDVAVIEQCLRCVPQLANVRQLRPHNFRTYRPLEHLLFERYFHGISIDKWKASKQGKSCIEAIELLKRYGVDPNMQDEKGDTILHHVPTTVGPEDVQCLLDCKADPCIKNNKGAMSGEGTGRIIESDACKLLQDAQKKANSTANIAG